MGEGLKIIEGRAIQCPGERIRGWVTFALMYAYSIFEFLAIHLRPLETVDVVQSDHPYELAIPHHYCGVWE